MNETDLIEFLLQQTKTVLVEIPKGTYNDWIKTQLPNRYRTGLISRKDYWDIYPDERESFRRGFSEKEDEEFLRIIEIADVEAIPANRKQYVRGTLVLRGLPDLLFSCRIRAKGTLAIY